jgi:hypothetical protein
MKKLTNKGSRRLGIPGRPALILDPDQSADIGDAQLETMLQNKTVSRWLEKGVLLLGDEDGKVLKPPKTDRRLMPKTGIKRHHRKRDERKEVVLPKGVKGKGTELHHLGGGWWQVYVNGFPVTDRNVRKDEAKTIAMEYEE